MGVLYSITLGKDAQGLRKVLSLPIEAIGSKARIAGRTGTGTTTIATHAGPAGE
jgi:hypothetical protein